MSLRTLLCVFILWVVPIPTDSRYRPFDSFLTLTECKDRVRQLEQIYDGPYLCLPGTINPNHQ
jgi:hypothetical protein